MAAAIDWAGILVGLFGILYAGAVLLASREGGEPDEPRQFCPFLSPFIPLGVLVPALILAGFGVSLLREPPFSPGLRLGWGFLLGGAWAFAAALILPWAKGLVSEHLSLARQWVAGTALSVGFASWTLAGVNVALLAFKSDPVNALLGFGIGFCTVAILVRAAGDTVSLDQGATAGWEALAPQAVLAVGLVAATSLGVHHFNLPELRIWWSLPLATAAAGIVAAVIGTRIAALGRVGERPGLRLFLSGLIAAVILAVLGLLTATKTLDSWPSFGCLALGLASIGLITWLVAAAHREGDGGVAFQATAFGALVVVTLVVACFKLLAGYGVALAFCAAWAIAVAAVGGLAIAPTDERAHWRAWGLGLMPFLAAWVLVPLYRLFMERYEAAALSAAVHYSFIGVAVGAIVMLVYAGYGVRTTQLARSRSPGAAAIAALARTGVLGLASVAVPLVFVALWGQQAAASLLAGLALGALVLASLEASAPSGAGVPPGTLLFGLGSALVAVQFTHLVEPLMAAPRLAKLWVVVIVVVVAVLWVVLDAAIGTGRRRKEDLA